MKENKDIKAPSPSEELVAYAQDILKRNDNLNGLLEKTMIPKSIQDAVARIDEINRTVFYDKEKGEGTINTMDASEMKLIHNELLYIYGELEPFLISSLSNFTYTNKKLAFIEWFSKVKNSKDDLITEAYNTELEVKKKAELKILMQNAKILAEYETEEWKIRIDKMADENARKKIDSSKLKVRTITEKDAEWVATEGSVYAIKINDFMDAYGTKIKHSQQIASKMMNSLEQSMMSYKTWQGALRKVT